MPIRFHALAALMLRNFRFSSFLERAHSIFKFASSDSTIRCATMQPSSYIARNIISLTFHLASP